jgi:hypothetical protein
MHLRLSSLPVAYLLMMRAVAMVSLGVQMMVLVWIRIYLSLRWWGIIKGRLILRRKYE